MKGFGSLPVRGAWIEIGYDVISLYEILRRSL